MTEEEFDSLMRARSFGTEDARRLETQMLRGTALLATLGASLWGKTDDDLRRQLLRSYPAIPPGFGVHDLHELLHVTAQMITAISAMVGLSHLFDTSPRIVVHAQSYTLWEARCEIVRRAIEHLEKS
jgi:hypothetical protein